MMFILTGTLEDHAHRPHAGVELKIQPRPNVHPDSDADVVYSQGWSGQTDENGNFTVELATFPGLTYYIRSMHSNILPLRRFAAPEDGALLDLADIVPIPAPSPMVDYVRGASAYAVAVAEGFVGTESEWLESLRGEPGPGALPTHQTIFIDADVTLPVDRSVLTLRVSAPAVLTVPDAPEGSVITMHVAEGWENISWAAGVIVTGDSPTTETWVVLVRKEDAWHALVSGSGGGGMTGHGRPDGKSWANGDWTLTWGAPLIAPLGTTYTDLDQTDGAVQWMVTALGYISWQDPETGTYPSMEDGPIWTVTVGQAEWSRGSQSYHEDPLTPPAGYDSISIRATRKGDWVDVRIEFLPSGIGQGVPVTVPAVESYWFRPPDNFSPPQNGGLPIEIDGDLDFIAAVGEPPQARLSSLSFLSIPSFEIGAFTAGEYFYPKMGVKAEYRIKDRDAVDPLLWPVQMEREPDVGDDGGGSGGLG